MLLPVFSDQTYTISGVHKIPIVSTDSSDIESIGDELFGTQTNKVPFSDLTTVSEEHQSFIDSNSGVYDNIKMAERTAEELEKVRIGIIDEIDDLPPDSIVLGMEGQAVVDRDRLWERKNEFRCKVRNFLSEHGAANPELKTEWETKLDDLVNKVKEYRKNVTIRIEHIKPTKQMSEFEKKSIEIQEKVLAEKKEKRIGKERVEKEEGLAKAKKELMSFVTDYEILLAELGQNTTPYEDRDDVAISTAMQDLKGWKSIFTRINSSYWAYESLARLHGEQDLLSEYDSTHTERETALKLFQDIKKNYEEAKDTIEELDAERGLYTNHKPIGEKLDYPKFSGSSGEDYTKFHDKMTKALRHNKVSKADQVERLRKNLSGFALGLVPESTESIEKAFTTLKAAFGDPRKVLDERMKKLKQVGDLPSERPSGSKSGFRKQEEWYLHIEGLLHDIIELGKRDNDLAYEVFSENTFNLILSLFPVHLTEKLEVVEGNRQVKLEGVLKEIGIFREKARRLGKVYGSKPPPDSGSGISSGNRQADRNSTRQAAQPGSFFKDPKEDPNCRICKQLEADGVTSNLFERHLSTYPTGCPNFITMKMVKRKDIAIKAKLCLWCLDPDITYDPNHRDVCRLQSGKIKRYTCEVLSCKNHMWLCSFHKQTNSSQLKKHQDDLKKKGLDMVLTSWCIRADKPVILLDDSEATESVTKAVRKAARNRDVQVTPVPAGRPMFLFFRCKGKKNGVNCFFDNGCSEAVFREGIPGGELIGEKTTRGPFTIGGVGGLECKANDEWLVSFETVDGHRQLIRGLTVNKVTEDFPLIKLDAAAAELKANCNDEWVKGCKIPKLAGGVTDALIGIQYNLVHPEPVHTLESGLCIFKSRLAPHKGGGLAMIGGPHSSFDALAGLSGGVSRVVAQFVQGLENYRSGNWMPPKIPINPVCAEEIMYAETMNTYEGDYIMKEAFQVEQDRSKFLEPYEDILEIVEKEGPCSDVCNPPTVTCNSCDTDYVPDIWLADIIALESDARFSPEEKLNKIKQNWSLLDSGLQIDYRCIKCRDCISCKNADQSEKISLREEQEMHLISQSVHLDWDRRKIVCSLPLRGKERDFLSTNRDRALAVLDQQCRKWYKDDVNRPLILAAFNKLFKTGDTRFLSQLSEEELSKFIGKEVQYFIPWRVVYNDSLSTPVRPVLDASTITRKRPDGSGGRCLNDMVCKGRIETLNLLRLALRFSIGLAAMSGDLSQFYYSCELVNEQWNLQRFLWRENLDPNGPVLEGIIGALIYGVKCVSQQTEFALEEIAKKIETEYPKLASMIRKCRYVDDFAESKKNIEELKETARQGDEVFSRIGLRCKGWVFSGEVPSEAVAKGGATIGVAGQRWWPRVDMVEIPIPELHFGIPKRGKLDPNVPRFSGDKGDLDNFVPKQLTRKTVVSKVASVWDLLGKFSPILGSLKLDIRKTTKATTGWTDPMPEILRNKWVENLWKIEGLRGIKFCRARMPLDAVEDKLRMITLVDAAEDLMMIGVWVGFLRKNGLYSCQHLIGRCLLTDENGTIPKHELQALTGGANLQCVVKKALGDWVTSSIVAGDSVIALCWATTENKPMAIYHRNRALQIRSSMNLENLYHVRTDCNPSDVGTRPSKVTLKDIGPDSRWERGDEWMKLSLESATSQGFIKPAANLRIRNDEEEFEYRKGIVFEKIPEILTKGHVVNERRVTLIEERAQFSQYLVLPTKFRFPKLVRILSHVMAFIFKCRNKVGKKFTGNFLLEGKLRFSSFSCLENQNNLQSPHVLTQGELESSNIMDEITSDLTLHDRKIFHSTQTVSEGLLVDHELGSDRYINLALSYLYRKASIEVQHFCKKELLTKLAVVEDGIVLSKGRLLDDMNFRDTGELGLTLGELGVRTRLPIIERHSPLAYCIAEHIHWKVSSHRGVETCTRMSAENVCILQAPTLYRELSDDCMICAKKRKRFLQVEMGPTSEHQLTLAPPFWSCQVDLFGPILVKVPGFERETRNRRVLEAKCWIMVAVCPTTRLVNMQTLESSKAAGWVDAFTRLCCEVGCPSLVFCDRDSAGMSGFNMSEFEIRDLTLTLHRERGIKMSLCPVSGHDKHGHVERVIRSVQEGFNDSGLKTKIIHATGLQTLCKLVEMQYNNLPIGYHYARSADNSPLLKIITPNFLRVGRINKRSLDGPIRIPDNRMEILDKVAETYESWFKIWRETLVPKLMYQQKWFKTDRELKKGDLVYFRKTDSGLDGKWVIGIVDGVERGRDSKIRSVDVKYQNFGETQSRTTSRTIRQLVKLWSIEDQHVYEDLAELDRKFRGAISSRISQDGITLDGSIGYNREVDDQQLAPSDPPSSNTRSKKQCRRCCCKPHCSLASHTKQPDSENLVLAVDLNVHQSVLSCYMDHQETSIDEGGQSLDRLIMSVGVTL